MNLDDLRNLPTPAPTGFEPGIHWDGESGHVTVATAGEEPDRSKIDGVLDTSPFLSSDEICVDWSARPRVSIQHDDQGNLRTAWYKLPLKRRTGTLIDVESLRRIIDKPRTTPPTYAPMWRTIQIADTHIGKGKLAGAGTDMLIERWQESITGALDCDDRAGIHLAFLGDLIEGEVSNGGKNATENDLFLQDQINVAAELVAWTIDRALEKGVELIVSAIPGNHGETGRQFSRPMRDSHDVGIVASVQREFRRDPASDRIRWYYPEENEGYLTYRVGDTVFTAVHGHNFRGKVDGAEKWWSGMTVNGRDPGAANVLMAGHFHSMSVTNFTRDKWIMFSPALETQSTWFAEKTGSTSLNGMLVYDTLGGQPFNIGVH